MITWFVDFLLIKHASIVLDGQPSICGEISRHQFRVHSTPTFCRNIRRLRHRYRGTMSGKFAVDSRFIRSCSWKITTIKVRIIFLCLSIRLFFKVGFRISFKTFEVKLIVAYSYIFPPPSCLYRENFYMEFIMICGNFSKIPEL